MSNKYRQPQNIGDRKLRDSFRDAYFKSHQEISILTYQNFKA
jgi:hypothetical protein